MHSLSVDYSIWHEGAEKPLKSFKKAACFAALRGIFSQMKSDSYVKFFVTKNCSLEEVEWYTAGLNGISLYCSMSNGEKFYNFRVYKSSTYVRMLTILTAIRYLHEGEYPKMIKWGFKKSQEDPLLDFFAIFQLMHYSISHLSTGHGFHGGLSPYGTVYKFVDLSTFLKGLDKAAGVNYTLLPKDKKAFSLQEKELIKKYMKNGEIGSFLKMADYDRAPAEVP